MSPQFVDFDADGRLDIVVGTYDGSVHWSRGSAAGWSEPVHVLDLAGEPLLISAFWNETSKKWDDTNRCAPPGWQGPGHLTSAVAFDWDGDGDLDLLLGDHKRGHVLLRRNEGSAKEPRFAVRNEVVHADGAPLVVPGTVATLRLVDWNGDGLLDLAIGTMGDAFGEGPGGAVLVHPNVGSRTATRYGAALTLVPTSQKGWSAPVRPDSGLYMDFADADGDGDLDLVVGGYSHWRPVAPALDEAQRARVEVLRRELEALEQQERQLREELSAAVAGIEDQELLSKKYSELYKAQSAQREALDQQQEPLQSELEKLAPGARRAPFVWFYENVAR